MKRLAVDGLELAVFEVGEGAQTVVFSHSYLADHTHYDAQVRAIAPTYRTVAYDHRDHGASGRASRPYELQRLVLDARAVLESVGGPVHWVGLSTGGFVGMRLALDAPELFRSLTLIDTSGEGEPLKSRLRYRVMLAALPLLGLGPFVPKAMAAMFSRSFLADPANRETVDRWRGIIAANDPRGLARFGRAIFGRASVLDRLGELSVPTLVLHGTADRALPGRGRPLADAIPGARYVELDGAGHLSTLERPDEVSQLLLEFLATV